MLAFVSWLGSPGYLDVGAPSLLECALLFFSVIGCAALGAALHRWQQGVVKRVKESGPLPHMIGRSATVRPSLASHAGQELEHGSPARRRTSLAGLRRARAHRRASTTSIRCAPRECIYRRRAKVHPLGKRERFQVAPLGRPKRAICRRPLPLSTWQLPPGLATRGRPMFRQRPLHIAGQCSLRDLQAKPCGEGCCPRAVLKHGSLTCAGLDGGSALGS